MSKEDFGVCVLGMGDCGSHITQITNNFNTTLNEHIKNQMINKNTTSNFMTGASQNLTIKGLTCGGNINISNIEQKAILSINFNSLDQSVDQNTFNNMMKNAVEATIERNNDIKQEFASAGADINQQTTNISNNISRVVSNDVYNDFKTTIAKMKADQDIGIIDVSSTGNCNISNIKQDIQLDMIVKTISDKMTENFNKVIQENKDKLDEKNKNKIESTGFFGDLGRGLAGLVDSFTGPFKWIAILIGVAIIVSVLGVAVWRIIAAATGKAELGKPQGIKEFGEAAGKVGKAVGTVASKVSSTGKTAAITRKRSNTIGGMFETMYGGW